MLNDTYSNKIMILILLHIKKIKCILIYRCNTQNPRGQVIVFMNILSEMETTLANGILHGLSNELHTESNISVPGDNIM